MTKVFIAGSRALSRLNVDVKRRIDKMIEKNFTILIGDANGADKAVQRYLAEKHFRNVVVHCMAGRCRNNVAGWPTREVSGPPGARGFAYYSAKDLTMSNDAEYGLMLWDGESKGTLNNILNMVHQKKIVVVYYAPRKRFESLKASGDLTRLLSEVDPTKRQRLERELSFDWQIA